MNELERVLVITGDHGQGDPTKWDGAYTDDDLALHRAMVEALESLDRFEVEVCSEHATLLQRLKARPPSLAVNFCDTGFNNDAELELHVPALLELLGVPYTGAPPSAMVLAYDKSIVNHLARDLGIPVPDERVLEPTAPVPQDLDFPLFVKPASGDGSVGIDRGALVRTPEALARQVASLRDWLPGRRLLLQEYLPGAELGLALVGNGDTQRALPPLRIDFSALPSDLPPILAFESKTGPATPYEQVRVEPADLSSELVRELVDRARRLFTRIGCRDYARFDFRTAADGEVKLMEVNPNPAWSREAKLARMAAFEGTAYPALLGAIVDAAWARTGGAA